MHQLIGLSFPLKKKKGKIWHCSSGVFLPTSRWVFLFFWLQKKKYFGHATQHVGSLLSNQESNPHPRHWVLTAGPPGNSVCTPGGGATGWDPQCHVTPTEPSTMPSTSEIPKTERGRTAQRWSHPGALTGLLGWRRVLAQGHWAGGGCRACWCPGPPSPSLDRSSQITQALTQSRHGARPSGVCYHLAGTKPGKGKRRTSLPRNNRYQVPPGREGGTKPQPRSCSESKWPQDGMVLGYWQLQQFL